MDKRVSARGIEVGHIFYFGTKYSEAMKARVTGRTARWSRADGTYGVGVSRLVRAIIEASHDANGIVWPVSVAPFEVALINLKAGDTETDGGQRRFLRKLQAAGIDVIYDDIAIRAGGKFATMDLIGVPYQLLVGPKGVKAGEARLKIARREHARRCRSTRRWRKSSA